MKITDLSIGNYVYNKNDQLCKVGIIDRLRNASVTVENCAYDDYPFFEYDITEVKPVPLTGDILAENDFVWNGLTSEWELKVNDDIVIIRSTNKQK